MEILIEYSNINFLFKNYSMKKCLKNKYANCFYFKKILKCFLDKDKNILYI